MSGYTNDYIQREVENKVRRGGGFSTFWVEENSRRAGVVTDMFADGRLVSEGGQYPFVACRIDAARKQGANHD